jgi:hypothetical protein
MILGGSGDGSGGEVTPLFTLGICPQLIMNPTNAIVPIIPIVV